MSNQENLQPTPDHNIFELLELEQKLYQGELNAAKIYGKEVDPQITEEHTETHRIGLKAMGELIAKSKRKQSNN